MSIWGKSKVVTGILFLTPIMGGAEQVPNTVAIGCEFSLECVDAEACQQTDYSVRVSGVYPGAAAQFDGVRMDSVSFSLAATFEDKGKSALMAAQDGDDVHLIMTTPDLAARYVYLLPEVPMVITYHGTCKQEPAK